ncbi:MAG TPA: ABC transporter permease [Bryobacteraceae bacterium]|nr:ABC transporter permease [Bryobacteraceae bacterium]
MSTLWQDLLYGLRMLLKKPGFTLVAALSLGLGIGANATIFSIINATLLSDLPYPEANRLMVLWTAPLNRPGIRNNVTARNYLAWKDRSQSFQSMGGLNGFPSNLGAERDGSPAERLDGEHFSYSMWDVLGVQPALGRVFTKDEDQDGNPAPVMVLSYPFWQRRFAGDPNVLGRKVLLDNQETTIIGVMPKGFDFANSTTDFWAPLGITPQQMTSTASFLLISGRLKPGVSMQQAQAEMDSIAQGLVGVFPGNTKDTGVRVEAMQGAFFQGLKQPLTVLQGAVGFVLLIACANVAGLLLARAASRRTEMAVRSSLGAGRGRIVRQLLTESVLLAILGGILGGIFAWGGLKAIIASLPVGSLPDVTVSSRVLGFTALVSIATGLFFGLIPALQTSKIDLSTAIKDSTRGGSEGLTKQRLRGALVTAQIGLALVLLIGAGLMMNSFLRIERNDLGGDPKGLLTFDFRFPQSQLMKPVGQQYRGVGLWDISPNVSLTYDRLFERLRGLPGVISAAGASRPPFAGAMGMQFRILGRPAAEPGPQGSSMNAAYMPITPNYFSTVRIPVLQGRDFTATDTASAPLVVIISKAMAQRWWANDNPLGQRIVFDFVPDEQPREIVGVVGDVRMSQTQTQPGPVVYLPHGQQSQRWLGPSWNYRSAMFYILRTSGNPTGIAGAVRSAVAEIDPSKPVGNLQTVEQNLRDQVSGQRVYMLLLTVFGAIAAVLAAVGIYGVMAYAVTQRTREIGIRMALGATSSSVMTLVVKQALILVFSGLILGIAGAFGLTRFLANQLYGVTATDPATFVEVSLGLVLVAVLASLIPTRRAVSVDPTVALRHE